MLKPEQYEEFSSDLDALAEPLRALFPEISFTTLSLQQQLGVPGIVVSAPRPTEAMYPFPISIEIRWTDEAIKQYVAADLEDREGMRDSFSGNAPGVVARIAASHGGVDWEGRSQASAHGFVVDLDQF
jgi:hypothetical protein